MASSTVPPIGARLRAARRHRGVTVRGLAREIGVSASLISQIETEKSSPSVSTLYALTTALGVSIEDLFGNGERFDEADAVVEEPEDAIELDDAADVPASPAGIPTAAGLLISRTALTFGPNGDDPAAGDRRLGPVVSPKGREVLTLDSGVTWELLGRLPHQHVDFLLITYEPGGSSSGAGLLMRHSGTEYGYVISGELTLTLGFETHRLTAGDSVSFDSTTPHAYRNESSDPAVGVWFVLERSV